MSENILGKNIKHMRKQYGETLEELGYSLNMAKSTVSGYERGDREPNSDTLKEISEHYGKTVDEMLSVKLYETIGIDSKQIVDIDEIYDAIMLILPLIESKGAYENSAFSKGVTIIKKMLISIRKGETVEGSVLDDAVDYFTEAAETDINEAAANMLWCIFFSWWQQYPDTKGILKFEERLALKQVDWKEMIYETQKYEKKSANMKSAFIKDVDEPLNELIKILKETEQWAPLGDYYLALRYVAGIISTELSNAMNQAIGMQMMTAFAQLGNKYALDFLKIDIDKK